MSDVLRVLADYLRTEHRLEVAEISAIELLSIPIGDYSHLLQVDVCSNFLRLRFFGVNSGRGDPDSVQSHGLYWISKFELTNPVEFEQAINLILETAGIL